MKISNSPAGWFSWGLALGLLLQLWTTSIFGQTKFEDAPTESVLWILFMVSVVLVLISLVNRYGE